MKTDVHTVITAAGDSLSMFLAAGFGKPKNLIRWEGSEVLVRSVKSYSQGLELTNVALNRQECEQWQTILTLQTECPGVNVTTVSPKVSGALVSALLAMDRIPDDVPLVVAAGDSQVDGGIARFVKDFIKNGADAGTIVFPSSDPRWSYVLPGDEGLVRQVAEKRVIGPLATTGVFYYRQAKTFRRAAEWCLVNNARHLGLFYVSTTLNYLISEGQIVRYTEIPRSEYRTWSLPIDFVEQNGMKNGT